MAFTKITAAGIGSTETVTLDGLSVINDVSIGGTVSIAGTLTYEDVTNVDSVGLITARNGIVVGSGITLSKDGDGFFTGIVTATTFSGTFSGDGTSLTGVASTDNIRTNTNATFLQNINVSGTVTATSYAGDGSALTGIAATANVRTGILDVAGISTFRNTMNVGAAVTISESGIEASGIGITVADINGGQIGGRRNLIINGAMEVAQRGTSFTNDGYGIDRFWWGMFGMDQAQTTRTQSTDAPSGFKYSQKINVTTVETSIDSGERAYIRYRIEGQDLQQLATGTSGAKKLTLSFYAKSASNNSGHQYSVYLSNHDISGSDRIQTRSFTVTSTWQRFAFTFDGQEDIIIRNDNDYGLQLFISLAAHSNYEASAITSWTNSTYKVVSGQSNFLASTNNDFFITGVQLEVGSQATAFEHRSFHEERLLCQRYYQEIAGNSDLVMWGSGRASTTSVALVNTPLSVPLRASPTISQTSYTTWGVSGSHSVDNQTPTVQYFHANNTFLPMQFHSTSSLTNARVATVACRDGSSLVMDAEL